MNILNAYMRVAIIALIIAVIPVKKHKGQVPVADSAPVSKAKDLTLDSLKRENEMLKKVDSQKTVQLNRETGELLKAAKLARKKASVRSVKAANESPDVIVRLDSIVYEPAVEKYKGLLIVDMDKELQGEPRRVDTVYIQCHDSCYKAVRKPFLKRIFGR